MAAKKTFLSRLFRTDSKGKEMETEQEIGREKETGTGKETERENEKETEEKGEGQALEEGGEEAKPLEPQEVDPYRLELPSDHAIQQLWRIRKREAGWLPVPVLRMEWPAAQQELLSEEELKKELSYLEDFVTTTAQKRLEQAQPEEEASEQGQKAEQEPEKKPLKAPASPNLDAQVEVFVASDKLSAWLLVYPPVGKGRELESKMLTTALERNEVTYGVVEELLDSLPENSGRYFRLYLAAQGRRVVDGTDGSIQDMFPRVKKQQLKVGEFERVNYTELNLVHNVKNGDVICKIIEPTSGRPGRTVLGKAIEAKEGKPAVVPRGRNTDLSKDGKCLVAMREGHVEFIGQSFQVKPVLEITGNVDYSTGNINFLGDVHVHGNICGGFVVRAMGSVTVDGVVESCTIEAGGDLTVVKGVKGDHQCVIQVHQNLYAKYLESALVCVKENVQTDSIINSSVFSDGVVEVCSGRGVIAGGKIWAASEVRANIVGTRSRSGTSIRLGGLPSQHFEYERLLHKIARREEEIEKLENQPDGMMKWKTLPDLKMKLSADKNKLKQYEKYLEEDKSEEAGQEGQQDSRRLICGIAFPETEITIGDASLRLNSEEWKCTAMLIRGEVTLLRL